MNSLYLISTQEKSKFDDFIESLPKSNNRLYQYQGFWYPKVLLAGVLYFQENFQAGDNDYLLASFPKSGTTWLKALMFALTQRSRYPNLIDHPLLTSNPHSLVPFVEGYYVSKKDKDYYDIGSPRLLSSHIPYCSLPSSLKSSGCKIVYLCRNPKDNFVSSLHFFKTLKRELVEQASVSDMFESFCSGVCFYGPYWEHVLGYKAKEKDGRVLFLTYEEVMRCPEVEIRRLAEFLECPFSTEEEAQGLPDEILKLCSFENMRSLEVNRSGVSDGEVPNEAFFRMGKVGDWVNFLTDDMVKKMDQITLEKFGENIKF